MAWNNNYTPTIPSDLKYLILHESPSEVNTIKKFLPKGYMAMATIWHFLRTESTTTSDIDTSDWNLEKAWKIDTSKRNQINNIKKAIDVVRSNGGKIILAWDHDREWQVINYEIVTYFKLKPNEYVVHRNPGSLAKDSYLKNLLNPLPTLDMNVVEAWVSRQLLDKYVGLETTEYLWSVASDYKKYVEKIKKELDEKIKRFEEKNSDIIKNNPNIKKIVDEYKNINFDFLNEFKNRSKISFWRVQTVSLVLLVQKELEKFEKELDRKVNIQAKDKNKFIWEYSKNKELETNVPKMKEIYEKINNAFKDKKIKNIKVKDIQSSIKKVNPLPTLDTIMAQESLSSTFWFNSKKVMDLLQKTYEKGYTTYMRTDTNATQSEEDKYIQETIEKGTNLEYVYRKYEIKGAQEWHIWILPTRFYDLDNLKEEAKELTDDEFKVFEYVVRRTIAAFLPEAKIEYFNYILEVEGDNWKEEFILKDTNIIDEWFLEVFIYALDKYKQKVFYKKDEKIDIIEFIWKEKDIKLPGGFTETSFTKELIKNGIWRPSTYVSNIEKLKDQGVIKVTGKKISVTPKGFWLYQIIKDWNFWQFKNVWYTAKMEQVLDEIANWKSNRKPVLDEVKKEIYSFKKDMPKKSVSSWNSLGTCPICWKGEIKENSKAWGCTNWKGGCKFTIWKEVSGHKITEEERDYMIKNLKTKGPLEFASKAGKPFQANLVFDKKKWFQFEFVN